MLDSYFDPFKIKILIVDDIPANIEVLQETLEPEGYIVSVATSGKMTLEVALHLKPDLVLLDIMMPGMDGYETCQKLKENEDTRDFPVIFISAKGETEDIMEGFRVGGVDYITKPFHGEEVLSRVKTHAQLHYLKKQQKNRIQELEFQNNRLEENSSGE